MSRFQLGLVEATSSFGSSLDLSTREFDVAVLFSSWDPRCLNPIAAGVRAKTTILVEFAYKGSTGRQQAHEAELRRFGAESDVFVTVVGESTAPGSVWPQLRDALLSAASEANGPLRLYLDLSAACRYYALGVVTMGLEGLAASVTVTYSEARYPEEKTDADKHEMFTLGRWESVPVPGLEGRWDPVKPSKWVVSLGFEGSKTFRAVSQGDPDGLQLVLPDPAFEPSYVPRTLVRNAALIDEYSVDTAAIIRAPAGDAVAMWRTVEEQAWTPSENLSYVCAGTKPHALGFALSAISRHDPAVLYLKPVSHVETHIEQSSAYWLYELRDVSLG